MSYSSLSTIREAQAGDIQARNRVVEENMGLVYMIVNRFRERGIMSKDDLVQEGVLGLMKAIDGFDASKGFEFSTYAFAAIRQNVNRAIQTHGTTIRIAYNRYAGDLDDYQNIMHPASLSAPVGDDGEFGDTIVDDSVEAQFESILGDGVEIASDVIDPNEVLALLDVLTDTQRETLERRLGLNGQEPETLAAIAKSMGKTRQAVCYLEGRAYRNLRKAWDQQHAVEQPSLKAQGDSRRSIKPRRQPPSDADLMSIIQRLSPWQRTELAAYYG